MSGDTIYSNPTTPEAIATALQAEKWNAHPINASRENKGRFECYGRGFILKTIGNMLEMRVSKSESTSFLTDGKSGLSEDLMSYIGCGVFAVQTPARDH